MSVLDFETLDDSLELRNLSFRKKRAVLNLMERYAKEKNVTLQNEVAALREQLTIKTLENIKGSSVLDEKNAELAHLLRVEAAAREVLGSAKDRTLELDRLAAALREAVQSTSSEAETEPK